MGIYHAAESSELKYEAASGKRLINAQARKDHGSGA